MERHPRSRARASTASMSRAAETLLLLDGIDRQHPEIRAVAGALQIHTTHDGSRFWVLGRFGSRRRGIRRRPSSAQQISSALVRSPILKNASTTNASLMILARTGASWDVALRDLHGTRRLSISLVEPTHSAPATRTGPLISSTGCMVAGSTISRYSSFNGIRTAGIVAAAACRDGGTRGVRRSTILRLASSKRVIQADRQCDARPAQMTIARAHGKTVGFAHRRHLYDLDRQIEVRHEPPDDRKLLRVLLAEVRAVRLRHLKELQHDGRHAREMSWPERSAQMIGQMADVDAAFGRLRVNLCRRWRKYDVDATARGRTQGRRRACADSAPGRPGC